MNVLSLFAGIGGLDLGLERAGMTVIGQVEIDPFCQRVLAKHWPEVPRHDDVRTAVEWWRAERRPRVDVVCGGFPCQDISNAGQRAGIIEGERSSLWTYLAHAVRELRPGYVVVENVAAILGRGLDVVAGDLAEIGYDLRWDCVPASAVGAPHRRDRWYGLGRRRGLADAEGIGCGQGGTGRSAGNGPYWSTVWPKALAHSDGDSPIGSPVPRAERDSWAVEPDVGRVANGVPDGVDRRRALGNAVVPQVAEHIGRILMASA